MLLRNLIGKRYKEQPSDAFTQSHIFMLRGGYIRQVSAGIFTLLTPAKRVAMKIENIIREEMDSLGMQEVLFPVVLPADLWRESGRYDSVGSELMRMKDRTGRDLVLGMTHEEAAVHLARSETLSHSEYPFAMYQIQTKFRDEPRARAGLIRVREFTMKDAYSFHTSQADLEEYYNRVHEAYTCIYRRVGLGGVVSVRSGSGMMGGGLAHEFMYLSDEGEDSLVVCPHCGYKSNVEVASCQPVLREAQPSSFEEVHTPGVSDIESLAGYLGTDSGRIIKATVFAVSGSQRPLVVFIRGDHQVNEAKLRLITGSEIYSFNGSVPGLELGFIGPYGLNAPDVDILFDATLKNMEQAICGANKTDWHYRGVSINRDILPKAYVDVAKACEGDLCPECGNPVEIRNGIEVGNIFQLGTKYTENMNMTYADHDGASRHPLMGCYGIGVGRLMACVLEEHHDKNGPIWPISIAPWQIHICMPGGRGLGVTEAAQTLYHDLSERYTVILDDRDAAAGVQFADADLLGAPIRVIVSERNMKNGEVEISLRDKSVQKKAALTDAKALIDSITNELYNELVIKY